MKKGKPTTTKTPLKQTRTSSEVSKNNDDHKVDTTKTPEVKEGKRDASKNKAGLEKTNKELTEKLKMVTKERDTYKNDLEKANKEFKEMKATFDKDTKKDKQDLQKANKELNDLQARIDKLSEAKKKFEKDMTLLQTNTKKERDRLESDLKENTMELTTCKSKLNTADAENIKLEKQLNDVQSRLNKAEAESKKRVAELSELQSRLNSAEAESKKRVTELSNLQSRLITAETDSKQREKQLTESSKRIKELTAANEELMTRLSKHLGAKLQDNNPNIADLSDPNRPTKLAEQFSGLYDDDWTNSYEVMKKHKQEVDVVDILLKACVKIYDKCITKASMELNDLQRVFLVFNSDSDVNSQKQLKDRRKKLKPDQQIIESDMNDLFGEQIAKHKKIEPYIKKCLDICWSMAIQDPPVHMDTDLNKKGHPFDNAAYRPYTQSGTSVDFIVWPALYLYKDGSLLQKGIAQGITVEDSVGGRRASPVNKQNRVKAS
ncbi:uncharacterized protein LOC127877832 [Dreissena polymorpha]|nr:uncharacterized protein LOC127877832 [Dreissena polymorpha]